MPNENTLFSFIPSTRKALYGAKPGSFYKTNKCVINFLNPTTGFLWHRRLRRTLVVSETESALLKRVVEDHTQRQNLALRLPVNAQYFSEIILK